MTAVHSFLHSKISHCFGSWDFYLSRERVRNIPWVESDGQSNSQTRGPVSSQPILRTGIDLVSKNAVILMRDDWQSTETGPSLYQYQRESEKIR